MSDNSDNADLPKQQTEDDQSESIRGDSESNDSSGPEEPKGTPSSDPKQHPPTSPKPDDQTLSSEGSRQGEDNQSVSSHDDSSRCEELNGSDPEQHPPTSKPDDQMLSSEGSSQGEEQAPTLPSVAVESTASPVVEGLESCAKLLAENRPLSYEEWVQLLQSLCDRLKRDMAQNLKHALDVLVSSEQVRYAQIGHEPKRVKDNSTQTDSEHCLVQREAEVETIPLQADSEKDVHKNSSSRCKRSNCCTTIYCNLFCCTILVVALALSVAFVTERKTLGTFSFTNFFAENPESADLWEKLDRRSIHILVTGKTGTGKSALINGLMGANVTKEGDTLDPTTAQVEQIKQMVHGISMSVFDSPGLQDGTRREDEYLRDMEQKCKNVDLVLYTIKLTDQRVHVADTNAMRKLTDAFGDRFWERAMFVMTFANEVLSPEYPEDEEENQKYFESRLKLWKEKLPKIVEERADIPLEIAKHVPVVPAGYYKTRDLPGRKYWFSKFWMAALNRIMETSAEEAGYMLEFTQDRLKNYDDMTEEDFRKPIHEQPILSKMTED